MASWKIQGEILEVQGSIERAREITEANACRFTSIETAASIENHFVHTELGNAGRIKIIILPDHETALNGYDPDPPDDRWLVGYMLSHVPWNSMSKPLWSLLQVYSWQIEHGVSNLSVEDLFWLAHFKEQVAWSWGKFGLEDKELRRRALEDFNDWRKKIYEQRRSEFEKILGIIEEQLRYDGLSIKKETDRWTAQEKGKSPLSGATENTETRPAQVAKHEVVTVSERTKALNKLATLWVNYNDSQRMSKSDDMEWFLSEHAADVGLGYVTVKEFKKHLPKAYKAGFIDKDKKTGRFIPKMGTQKGPEKNL